jgi:hypothetical protein
VYALYEQGYGATVIDAFHRENAGAIGIWGVNETDAPPYDSSCGWLQYGVAADLEHDARAENSFLVLIFHSGREDWVSSLERDFREAWPQEESGR